MAWKVENADQVLDIKSGFNEATRKLAWKAEVLAARESRLARFNEATRKLAWKVFQVKPISLRVSSLQ